MSEARNPGHGGGQRRWGHAQADDRLDPYQRRQKLQEPTACPDCGAIFHRGRWQWGTKRPGAASDLCPACHRIRDKLPAGTVVLRGAFARAHKAELLNLARHQEALEKAEHALNRIMSVAESDDAITIATTDIHLPRRIGEAIRSAYHGTLDLAFDENTYFARIAWERGD